MNDEDQRKYDEALRRLNPYHRSKAQKTLRYRLKRIAGWIFVIFLADLVYVLAKTIVNPMVQDRVRNSIVTAPITTKLSGSNIERLVGSIEPVIPSGYCEFGKDPADDELAKRTADAIGDSNRILMLFANCTEIDEFRTRRRTTLDNFGQILVPTPKGKVVVFPQATTRSAYISRFGDQGNIAAALAKAEVRLRGIIPSTVNPTTENLGALGADANAGYVGAVLVTTDVPNRARHILLVMGVTLVKGLPVTVNLYRSSTDAEDLGALMALQRTEMGAIVNANK